MGIMEMREAMQKELSSMMGCELSPENIAKMREAMKAVLLKFVPEESLPYVVVLRSGEEPSIIKVFLVDPKHAPRFKNDCVSCKYLGASDHHDHYYCTDAGYTPVGATPLRRGSCVARYGNGGDDYTSAPAYLCTQDHLDDMVRVTFEVARRTGVLK
jgi:hypothetical protein